MESRSITPFGLFAIGFGAIVGVGWVVLAGTWLTAAGPLGASIAFAVGSLAIAVVALNYTVAARQIATGGGEMSYAAEYFGDGTASVVGAMMLLLFLGVSAFEAIAIGWIIPDMLQIAPVGALYQSFGQDVSQLDFGIAVAGSLLLTGSVLLGSSTSVNFQRVLIFVFVVACLAFVVSGALKFQAANLVPLIEGETSRSKVAGIVEVLAVTPFFFVGFNAMLQGLREVEDRVWGSLRWNVLLTVVASLVFYLAVIAATASLVPREMIAGSEFPVAMAFELAFGSKTIASLILGIGLLGLLTTWNAMFFASTRLIVSMAERGFLPSALAAPHSKFSFPPLAALATGGVTCALALLGRGFVDPIVSTASLIVAFLFLVVCLGVTKRAYADNAGVAPKFIAILGVVISIALTVIIAWDQAVNSKTTVPTEWVVLLSIIVGSLIYRSSRRSSFHTASSSIRD